MRFIIIIVAVALMLASCQVAEHEQVIAQGEEDNFIDALISAKDLRVS